MLIAILVLVAFAGLLVYLRYRQSAPLVSVSQEDINTINGSVPQPEYQETPAKEEVKQAEPVVVETPVAAPIVEAPAVETKPKKKKRYYKPKAK